MKNPSICISKELLGSFGAAAVRLPKQKKEKVRGRALSRSW